VVKQTQQLPLNGVLSQAFGLLVMAGGQRNVHEGVRGHEPDKATMRAESVKITQAMDMVRVIAPDAGGYSSEMRYDDQNWQTNAWGDNYPRLLAIKKKYDPTGLFMAHHYVGSEGWVRD
jgi:FAD/FMN-containing dehydrogenase